MSRALLLAAGKATRLQSLRDDFAKACVPIGQTTPLGFLLPQLHAAGVQEVWINLHWKADQVREVARRAAPAGLVLHFMPEPELLGTGGTLLRLFEECGELADLVLNAKIFTDFDFADCIQAPLGSLVLHTESELATFGGLRHDGRGQITGLLPRAEAGDVAPSSAAVYTGISRPAPVWLEYLRQARAQETPHPLCLLRHGLLPALAAGHPVQALLHTGLWCEISTPERVEIARRLLAQMTS